MDRSRAATEIVRRLRDAGHEAYWVGGCVRDRLWGLEPEDYDIATAATPEQVRALFESTREVGKSFGVVQVELEGHTVEVATFRAEGDYADARHPSTVRWADARRDAMRRDFTINALFYDPLRDAVLDFVGGRRDLEHRVLRAVGDPEQRFAEDALRLLRAVRFAARFDLTIEAATRDALGRNAPALRRIAGERIRDEMLAMLTGPNRRRALELLADLGLLAIVAPELLPLRGCEQSLPWHPEGDVWEHTLRMVERADGRDPWLVVAALLHDIGKPATRRVVDGKVQFHGHSERGAAMATALLERWRVSGAAVRLVADLVRQHLRFLDVPRMRRSTLRRFLLQPEFPRLLELHRLDVLASHGDLSLYERCRSERQALEREPPPVRPLLNGHELMRMGYVPGPRLGAILHALVDAQLEGEVTDPDSARAWVRQRFAPDAPGGT